MDRYFKMNRELAEIIAISGLDFIASDDDQLGRFLALTGAEPEHLRQSADNPTFLVAVLDFFLGHEPTLIRFARQEDLAPEAVVKARNLLAGPEGVW